MQTTISAPCASPVHAFNFHGASLDVVVEGDDLWVSVRRVCEALQLPSNVQLEKLKHKPWARMEARVSTGADGRQREQVMIHLDCLPMWLATIHTSRVKPEIRSMLERFQLEAARVLRDHFFGKPAAAPEPAAAEPALLPREQWLPVLQRWLQGPNPPTSLTTREALHHLGFKDEDITVNMQRTVSFDIRKCGYQSGHLKAAKQPHAVHVYIPTPTMPSQLAPVDETPATLRTPRPHVSPRRLAEVAHIPRSKQQQGLDKVVAVTPNRTRSGWDITHPTPKMAATICIMGKSGVVLSLNKAGGGLIEVKMWEHMLHAFRLIDDTLAASNAE